jgi:hypothetical protein
MMFTLIGKLFHNGKEKEDEFEPMCAVTLVIQMLENVKGIESNLINIINFFITELAEAKSPDYKSLLSQGLCMCFWYSTPTTVSSLDSLQATSGCFQLFFSLLPKLNQDFEIKRFVVGFTSILQTDPSQVSQSIQTFYGDIAKAVVFLCQMSIDLKIKEASKEKKDEEAEEDKIE